MLLLAPAILTMAAAQMLDLATFVTMVDLDGPRAEANPLILAILGSGGIGTVVLAKVALVVLVAGVAVMLYLGRERGSRRAGAILLGCATVAGLVGSWSNAVTIGFL